MNFFFSYLLFSSFYFGYNKALTFSNSMFYKTLQFKPSNLTINNPERGFYAYTEVSSNGRYRSLDQNILKGFRSRNLNLVFRLFFLESFVNKNITIAYLRNVRTDLINIRMAGLKCIIRFAYSNVLNGRWDASLEQILFHIDQLKPLFSEFADVIAVVQNGFIGKNGEEYYSSEFPSDDDYFKRGEILRALLKVIPSSRFIQYKTPLLKQKMFDRMVPLDQTEAFKETDVSRLGIYFDLFAHDPLDDSFTYVDIHRDTNSLYFAEETKYTPMGGNTNNPWLLQTAEMSEGNCSRALTQLETYHYSFLRIDSPLTNAFKDSINNCFDSIEKRLGYRYELVSIRYPQIIRQNTTMIIDFTVKNNGFASAFNKRPMKLVFRSRENDRELSFDLSSDPRLWLPSPTSYTIRESIKLGSIRPGLYNLLLSFPDPDPKLSKRPEYSIRLANDGLWEEKTGFHNLNLMVLIWDTITLN